jgi:hypothetical protein
MIVPLDSGDIYIMSEKALGLLNKEMSKYRRDGNASLLSG